jgi:hypothetical protein
LILPFFIQQEKIIGEAVNNLEKEMNASDTDELEDDEDKKTR